MSLKDIFGKWKKTKKDPQDIVIDSAVHQGTLTGDLEKDRQAIYNGLGAGVDIMLRRILIGQKKAALIYIDGIVDSDLINREIINQLQELQEFPSHKDNPLEYIAEKVLSNSSVVKIRTLAADFLVDILLGNTAVIVDGFKKGITIETRGGIRRGIEEPPTERTVRGSREGFIEDLAVNLASIRRRIRSPQLAIEATRIGQRSVTKVALVYLSDVADPSVVKEIRRRISRIEIDGMIASGYIERFIEDHKWSIFPQMYGTERPDKVVANLLEGRIAIMVDGTPFVLLAPAVFLQFLQGAEDYYERTVVGSAARLVRYLALMITTTITSVYIALITFHHSLMPTDLLLAVAEEREQLPFTPLTEALFMEVVVEILREAGLRLPASVGQTLGVVGGIVIGQAVVEARLVSPLIVVIVSLAAVSSFVFPNYSMALSIRLIKFPMMFLAASFGAVGIAAGWLLVTIHLVSMESFGVPYMGPLSPMRYADMGDTFVVSHIKEHRKRPASIPHIDNLRIDGSPGEPENEK
ncbi:MAG: spore germination protein [Bacillota bacterium]